MKLSQTSTVKSLFSMPAIEIHSSRLLEAFTANLTSKIVEEAEAPQLSQEPEEEQQPMEVDRNAKGNEDILDNLPPIEDLPLPPVEDVGPIVPEIDIDFPVEPEVTKEAVEPQIEKEAEKAEEEQEEEDEDEIQKEDEENADDKSVGESAETDESIEQKRWNKRAQQLVHRLESEYKNKDTASFKELVRKNARKQAAYKFYAVLILNKEKVIEATQSELYGDICLKKGESFHDHV